MLYLFTLIIFMLIIILVNIIGNKALVKDRNLMVLIIALICNVVLNIIGASFPSMMLEIFEDIIYGIIMWAFSYRISKAVSGFGKFRFFVRRYADVLGIIWIVSVLINPLTHWIYEYENGQIVNLTGYNTVLASIMLSSYLVLTIMSVICIVLSRKNPRHHDSVPFAVANIVVVCLLIINIVIGLLMGTRDRLTLPFEEVAIAVVLHTFLTTILCDRMIQREKAGVMAELSTASYIQKTMLPGEKLDCSSVRLCASMRTAKQVGGDFYDHFFVDSNHLVFLMADVSGKGIPAALYMVNAKTQIKQCMMMGLSPGQTFARTNNMLRKEFEDNKMFVTVWMGVLNTCNGEVEFVNAAHNYPYIIRSDGNVECLKKKSGVFLGFFKNKKYNTYSVHLEKGDRIFLYTDGVTEADNIRKERYGAARLEDCLRTQGRRELNELCEYIISDVDMFVGRNPQFDDITMLAMEYVGESVRTYPAKIENVPMIKQQIRFGLEENMADPKAIKTALMAAEELCVNVCSYAYQDSEGDITVRTYADNGDFIVEMRDNGAPFDPLNMKVPDFEARTNSRKIKAGGLGIFLVKNLVKDITYQYIDEQNVVTLVIDINNEGVNKNEDYKTTGQ